jgi:cytochrome c
MTMLSRGILLAVASLALCVASLAGAQENLDKNKTGAQLYASDCAVCHKSPQSVTTAPGIFGLEYFLRDHYTVSSESAATIAAYLNGLRKAESPRGRAAKRTSQAKPSKPPRSESKGDESPLDTAQRALKGLLQTIKPEN